MLRQKRVEKIILEFKFLPAAMTAKIEIKSLKYVKSKSKIKGKSNIRKKLI